MNFQEFQATGRDSQDLAKETGAEPEGLSSNTGRIYAGGVFLEHLPDGTFSCTVFCDSIVHQDLAVVERFLYDNTYHNGECVL